MYCDQAFLLKRVACGTSKENSKRESKRCNQHEHEDSDESHGDSPTRDRLFLGTSSVNDSTWLSLRCVCSGHMLTQAMYGSRHC